MRVLVTGGSGFVGKHLSDALIEHGDEVDCLVHKNWGDINAKVKLITGIDNMAKYDRVYHMAGVLGQKDIPLIEYSTVHVKMAYDLLRTMNTNQHFIYMSSAWVNIVDKPYELTKYDGEYLVKASRIPYTIVRPGFIYGGGDMHHLKIFQMVKKMGMLTPIIGSGQNRICPTYIKDVIESLVNCKEGELNIAGEPITTKDFLDNIADVIGVGRSLYKVSIVPNMFKEMVKWDFFTKERVFKSDVKTTLLVTGLVETVNWYKKNGYL
jgi:UDP-glucose 4-epimerase